MKRKATTKKIEQRAWWRPELDTPVGRVELDIRTRDSIWLHADWMQSRGRLLDRDNISINLKRAANGSWKPEEIHRDRRHRETIQVLADAVTAWMATDPTEKNDLLRRAEAFHATCNPYPAPKMALDTAADKLLSDIKAGLFNFADEGHARATAMRAAERLRQMGVEIDALIWREVYQAIKPASENRKAAA